MVEAQSAKAAASANSILNPILPVKKAASTETNQASSLVTAAGELPDIPTSE